MAIRMGYWDCSSCQHDRIEGPRRECPQCGRPRDDGVAFYTTDDAPEIDDPALLQRARAGSDWHCPFCDGDNPAAQQACLGCGASDPSARRREQRLVRDAAPAPASPRAPRREVRRAAAGAKRGGRRGRLVALGVLALVVVGAWLLFVRSRPLELRVEKSTWTRTLVVERLETSTDSAWADQVPSGAREVRREMRGRDRTVQDGTERVHVGQRDLGNGLFEDVYEDRPRHVTRRVDEPWVTFAQDRWVKDRTLEERRDDGTEPPEPAFTPDPTHRAGAKASYVSLTLKGDGRRYTYRIDVKDAASRRRALRYQVGREYEALVTAAGGVRRLEAP